MRVERLGITPRIAEGTCVVIDSRLTRAAPEAGPVCGLAAWTVIRGDAWPLGRRAPGRRCLRTRHGVSRFAEQDGAVRFRVLGPLEIRADETWAGISAPKWRSLLAALLINAGQVVPTDRLILEVWGDSPPARATNLVSVYALRLRRLLGDENGQILRTRAPGYQLLAGQQDVDALCFDELVTEGRQALAAGEMPRAAALLAGALGLWHGSAFVDVPPSALVTAEAGRLERARLDALELRIEADIGCGRHAQVIPELSRLTTEQPMREGLWGLLMRALDGAGRHAEALAAYSKARDAIADELGVDPGERLQRLFEQILTEDAGRHGGAAATPVMPAPQPAVPPPPEPPRQLPAGITDFTGRVRDLELLSQLLPGAADDSGAVKVALVTGAGGLGKTTLAVHAAHRLRPHFPDGQLYANLLGATPQPLAPADVLARFLRDLGVPGEQIPVDEDERAALMRTRLTGRRVLMLLDNARDSAQVRPLLPGSASCAVMVTTRHRLPGLATTRLVDLDVLGKEDALALFASIVGTGRVAAEPAATDEVLAACAGLPLAIRIAGARLAARPGWTVATLASKVHSEQRRLDELRAGDLAVRATFEVSFASLPGLPDTERIDPAGAFRLLGLWAGPTISLPAAAALFGQPGGDTEDALEELVDAHLLESPAPGVYRFHDLLRVYAAERSRSEPPASRQQALRRILTWYLHTAEAAARIISPHYTRVTLGEPPDAVRPPDFSSLEEALGWCESERVNLVAATRQASDSGMHDIAWRLPAAAMRFFYRRSHWVDWITTHQTGLAAARELGDRQAEARMLHNLGMVHGLQRREEAIGFFEQAMAIHRELDDHAGEARAATGLATAFFHVGRFQDALDAGRRSLLLQRAAGDRHGEGIALGDLGCASGELGLIDDAISFHQQALTIFRELGDTDAEADSLTELAGVYLVMGRIGPALDCLDRSLAIRRDIRDRYGEAVTLQLLGQAMRQGGQAGDALGPMTEAQRIFDELGDHRQAAEIRSLLDELLEPCR
jgi:DNA-binding SARP family transcriptional activator